MPGRQRIVAPRRVVPAPGGTPVDPTRDAKIKAGVGRRGKWTAAERDDLLSALLDDYLARTAAPAPTTP